MSKFTDQGESVYYFLNHFPILLKCPDCNKVIVAKRHDPESPWFRLVCKTCGIIHQNDSFGSWGNGVFYGIPTWLHTRCCGQTLWALNKEHFEFMEGYLTATLRERIPNENQSLASRLPHWMQSSKNREELVKGFKVLRKQLEEAEKLLN